MAFIPKLSVCALNSCSTLRIREITGLYNVLNNLQGWESPNPSTADIVTAELIITSPSGIITTIDVLSQLPVPYVEVFYFNDITIIPEDGEWTIQYKLTTDGDPFNVLYSNILKTFLTCSVRCCIDKIHNKVLNEDLGCGCNYTTISDLTKKWLFMESLYYSMMSTKSCNNSDTRNKLLKQLQRLCKIEKCNC